MHDYDENPRPSLIPPAAEIEARIAWHQAELKWAKRLLRLAQQREAETPGPLLALIEAKVEAAGVPATGRTAPGDVREDVPG